jgi:hypothetical protein
MPTPLLPKLKRPLVVLDLETTGTVAFRDRIVEIAMLKAHPDGRREKWERRVNPEVRIPIEATAIHGITNQDVEGCPPFRRIAEEGSLIGDADPADSTSTLRLGRSWRSCPLRQRFDGEAIGRRRPGDLHRHGCATPLRGALLSRPRTRRSPRRGTDVEATRRSRWRRSNGIRTRGSIEGPRISRRPTDRYVDPDRSWSGGWEACFTFGNTRGRTS